MIELNDEKKEQALNFGALNYDENRICTMWDCSPKDLGDDFWRIYKRGEVMAEYVMDLKLFEMAKGGDIRAMQQLKNNRQMRKR